MRHSTYKEDVIFFYLYRISSRFYFHLPVLFPFFFSVELGVFTTESLLATYGLAIMLSSKLSSKLLSHMRQKLVIAIGEILKALGLLLIILGTTVADTNLWIPLIGQILGGTGFSLAISTDTSLLRSITKSDQKSFGKIQAQTQSYMFVSTLIAGTTGSILFSYEAHWPFYASTLANCIAIIFIMFIQGDERVEGKILQQKTELRLDEDQKFWVNFYVFSRAFALAAFVGFLPFFFVMLGVDPYLFGAVLSLFSIGAFFSARYSNQILDKFGIQFIIPLITSSMLISMFLFAFFDYFPNYFTVGLAAIFLLGLSTGGVRPLVTSNLKLNSMSQQHRTKLLSLMELRFGISNACILIAGSYLLSEYNFQTLMFGCATLYISLLLFSIVSRFLKF